MRTVITAGMFLGALFCASDLRAALINEDIFAFSPTGSQQLILNGSTTINAASTGWYFQTGNHNSTNSNYITGNCFNCSSTGEFRSFFVFSVPAGITITSASLSIGNPSNGYTSPVSSDTLSIWDISTAIATLIASQSTRTDIFGDLGSGTLFAARTVDSSTNGTQVSITLNAAALTALNAATGQQIAFGGALNLVPEPATISLISLGLIGTFAARRIRRPN